MRFCLRGIRYVLQTLPRWWSVAKLGATPVERVRLFTGALWYAYQRGSSSIPSAEKTFQLRANGVVFSFTTTSVFDIRILYDVFQKKEYEIEMMNIPRVIFDVGGNVGVTAIYFALEYPEAEVHVFEPDPQTFEQLRKNTYPFSRIRLHQYAISSQTAEAVDFYNVPHRTESASLLPQRATKSPSSTVRVRTLADALRISGCTHVDLLKFDVEGAEYAIFSEGRETLQHIQHLIGEVHIDLLPVEEEKFRALFQGHEVNVETISPERYILRAMRTV